MGIATLTSSEITMATYITAFFLAIGTDIVTKEGFTVMNKKI